MSVKQKVMPECKVFKYSMKVCDRKEKYINNRILAMKS